MGKALRRLCRRRLPRRRSRPFDNPIKKDSHLVILHGNLSPTGAVAKITGKEGLRFEGTARVYHGEEVALAGILNGEVGAGDVIVIRYEGPRGGPGMREMLSPTSAVMGKGLGKDVALITDGRFSGGSHGFVVGHITPEAFDGGPIALLENGDAITIRCRNPRDQRCGVGCRAGRAPRTLDTTGTALHARRAGQVRQAGIQRLGRCRHRQVRGCHE